MKELDDILEETDAENQRLRRLLWLNHGHTKLYGDDGEMQCSECAPGGADFRREPIENLEAHLFLNSQRKGFL